MKHEIIYTGDYALIVSDEEICHKDCVIHSADNFVFIVSAIHESNGSKTLRSQEMYSGKNHSAPKTPLSKKQKKSRAKSKVARKARRR